MGLARSLPLEVNLAKIQNICYELLQTAYRDFQQKAQAGRQKRKSVDGSLSGPGRKALPAHRLTRREAETRNRNSKVRRFRISIFDFRVPSRWPNCGFLLATYRLQFNGQFRFEHARALVGYLDQLGVTDIYASPLLQARRGSGHGYDVTDPSHLNS